MIEVRSTAADEARAVANLVAATLLFPRMTDEEWARRESSWNETDSVSAWDGERCVGHAGAFKIDTTVPGGARLRTAGVTRIGVLATHTRQGLLTAMMTKLLGDARAAGAPLASLRASEAVIYERYGFGVAGEAVTVRIDSGSAGLIRSPAPGSMRILHNDEVITGVPDLYDRCARWRVGTISRPHSLWTRYLADAMSAAKPSFVAVHHGIDGAVDGYVHYDVRWREDNTGPSIGVGEVHDLYGTDAAVERALWAFILDVDLVVEWTADERPIDEPVRFAVRDTRAYRVRERWDEQWLRLLDVDAALRGRSYQPVDRQVVVEVTDPMFADNSGSWRIVAAGAERTDAPGDLVASIADLSAAYLGGTSWSELADSGRLGVRRPGAVADADSLFQQNPRPFCGSFF